VSLHNSTDTFVFHSDLGVETAVNAATHVESEDLANHPQAQTANALTALITPDAHHEAFFDLVHNDGAPAGVVSPAQWHALLNNGFHLH